MKLFPLAFPALALASLSPVAASEKGWDTASHVGVISLSAWSIGVPAVTGDGTGAWQAAASTGVAYGMATVMKEAIPSTRPDLSDDRSFPSGHTSAAFGAAVSILERRGVREGIPAIALASFVGVARVQARRHRWTDILAGAAVGTASGLLLTKPLASKRLAIAPWADSTGGGTTIHFAF